MKTVFVLLILTIYHNSFCQYFLGQSKNEVLKYAKETGKLNIRQPEKDRILFETSTIKEDCNTYIVKLKNNNSYEVLILPHTLELALQNIAVFNNAYDIIEEEHWVGTFKKKKFDIQFEAIDIPEFTVFKIHLIK